MQTCSLLAGDRRAPHIALVAGFQNFLLFYPNEKDTRENKEKREKDKTQQIAFLECNQHGWVRWSLERLSPPGTSIFLHPPQPPLRLSPHMARHHHTIPASPPRHPDLLSWHHHHAAPTCHPSIPAMPSQSGIPASPPCHPYPPSQHLCRAVPICSPSISAILF